MMHRRAFLTTVVAGIAAAPVMGDAQQAGKVWRIGVLVTGPRPDQHVCVLALRRGLADLGYVDGTTHILDTRWAEGHEEKIVPRLARDLVKSGVDVVVTVSSQGLIEAMPALAPVPVVMAASHYPVERGIVRSLNHPGGNITGMATFSSEMVEKRMQLLAEAVRAQRASRFSVFRAIRTT
jgi:putative ABC transport system substrate-binding protein